MSAGTGVTHSEKNASSVSPSHLVQMWVLPDTEGIEPSYEQCDVSERLKSGELVTVASGSNAYGAITIHQHDAELLVGRLSPNHTVIVPEATHVHVYIARGGASIDGVETLLTGDAARLTGAGTPSLTADALGAEILIWATA